MPETQVNCPNCRQPVTAEIDQLFDVNIDPAAKQRLLSGAFNFIQCPLCGYQGNLATPIVYHDPEKEILLKFIPAELGLPHDEQEKLVGGLINQAISKLPSEKRKGYLFQPQTALTLQGLVERILEADGITREMIEAQQQRLSLLQRLAGITDDSLLVEVAGQEEALIDSQFFALLGSLVERASMSGDQQSAKQLTDLQQKLLPITSFGRELQAQSQEVEAAVADLRAAGQDLNRDKLLDLVLDAPNDTRLMALASLARPVMDYAFFQLLSDRIEREGEEERARLIEIRSKLLEMTDEIDRQLDAHIQETRTLIKAILQADDVGEAMAQSLQAVDEFFVQEVKGMLEEARQQGDLGKSGKLQEIMDFIQQASQAPPEVALVQEYLDILDEEAREQFLETHQEEITPDFISMLANFAAQVQSGGDVQFAEHAMAANHQALRFSMKKSMQA